jgi:hypothetical protein
MPWSGSSSSSAGMPIRPEIDPRPGSHRTHVLRMRSRPSSSLRPLALETRSSGDVSRLQIVELADPRARLRLGNCRVTVTCELPNKGEPG